MRVWGSAALKEALWHTTDYVVAYLLMLIVMSYKSALVPHQTALAYSRLPWPHVAALMACRRACT